MAVREEAIGPLPFLLVVVATAIISNGVQVVFSGPPIGISGVICGIIGFMWQARRDYESLYIWMSDQAFKRLMIMLAVLIPIDYFVLNGGERFGVAHVAHFAGVAAGAAIARSASQRYTPNQRVVGVVGLILMILTITSTLLFPVKWSKTRTAYDNCKA